MYDVNDAFSVSDEWWYITIHDFIFYQKIKWKCLK
jgi:hypothetical protein